MKLKITLILLSAVVSLAFGINGFCRAYAEISGEPDDNDNFGSLTDLTDISSEKLILKEDSSYIITDELLLNVDPGTDCAFVISSFKNSGVAVFDKNGRRLSNGDTVGTSFAVKLLDSDGKTADSRVVSVKGDANGDGECTSLDASYVLRFDVGLIDWSEEVITACDLSGDGAADAIDAVIMLKYDCGLINDL